MRRLPSAKAANLRRICDMRRVRVGARAARAAAGHRGRVARRGRRAIAAGASSRRCSRRRSAASCSGSRCSSAERPGAGKSTLCAELAAQIAGEARWLTGIGSTASKTKAIVRELFPRTGSSSQTHPAREPTRKGRGTKVGWREALKAVPPDAAVIVVDSLQRWAVSLAEQTELLEPLSTMPPTVLVVSHFNKAGQFAGRIGNEYDVDATAIVRPKSDRGDEMQVDALSPRRSSHRDDYRGSRVSRHGRKQPSLKEVSHESIDVVVRYRELGYRRPGK